MSVQNGSQVRQPDSTRSYCQVAHVCSVRVWKHAQLGMSLLSSSFVWLSLGLENIMNLGVIHYRLGIQKDDFSASQGIVTLLRWKSGAEVASVRCSSAPVLSGNASVLFPQVSMKCGYDPVKGFGAGACRRQQGTP